MSDLQCPATILLLTPATAAVSDMREYRLSLVVTGNDLDAISLPAQAKRADLPHAAALAKEIAELADLYRGEQVAIVANPLAVRELLRLSAPPTAAIAIVVDSDGWQILSR